MASNLVTKLGVDPSKYVSGMDQARKSLDQFQKQNMSTKAAMKEVTSVLTKYVSVAAAVKAAQEVLTRTIQGSQKTADGFAATMDGCKNAVDTFFTALSKGDFSSFARGLDQIITKGKLASMAMDQLGNTIMSFNYLSASNTADFADALLTIRDTKATPAERAAAVKAAEKNLSFLEDITKGKEASLYKAIAAVSTKKSPLSAGDFVFDDIRQISLLDALADTPDKLKEYGLQSKDYYLKQAQEYAAKVAEQQAIYRNSIQTINPGARAVDAAALKQIQENNVAAKAVYDKNVSDLTAQYRFALEVQALLEDIKDEDLQGIFNLYQQIADAEMQVTNMTKQLMQAKGEYKRGLSTEETVITAPSGAAPLGALPAAAGIMEVPEMDYQTKLPEINTGLQNINGSLTEMSDNLDSVSTGFQSMAAASDGVNSLGRSVEQIGAAFSSFGSSGIGNTIGAIGSAIQAYAQLAASAASAAAAEGALETPTIWGKIAALGSFAAAYTSMVSTMKSMSDSYAEGGVIPGQNYNDGITARVSSGEMIINEADQKRLYDSIHSGSVGGGGGSASVTGEQIVIAVNNYGRRTNRGELVFAGRG